MKARLGHQIKRLKIRKYYDYSLHRYVSFADIGEMIAAGEDLDIRNHNGRNIYSETLLKVLAVAVSRLDTKLLLDMVKKAYSLNQ